MNYDFSSLKENTKQTAEWLKSEYLSIQTGRATPVILDVVKVDSYGSLVPINHMATVTTEDAKTIRIVPWDMSQVRQVEKALNVANLGVSVIVDEKGLRVIFPELTTERREMLGKLVKQKLEEARISVRGARDEVWSDIQEKERKGDITEDDKFRLKEEMQKIVDDINEELTQLAERKEKDILA